ncbi:MAG: T9SS type A sorting domain-containing protein [Flavobacteriaceae bacterium]
MNFKTTCISFFTLISSLANAQDLSLDWQNTIGGSEFDFANDIVVCADGSYLLIGSSESNISGDKTEDSYGEEDYWIIKLNSLGNIEWQKTIGGNDDDFPTSAMQTQDGGYILGGESYSNASGLKTENVFGHNDYWIVKINNVGEIEWQNNIGGSGRDYFFSISQTFDGGYILGGSSESNISGDKTENSNGHYDYWIVKTNANGEIEWQNTIGGDGSDILGEIIQTNEGGYIIAGQSSSDISGDKTEDCIGGIFPDYWIVKLDELGTIEWQNTIGGTYIENIASIIQTTDGGYLLGGHSMSDASDDKSENCLGWKDYWIVKLSKDGNIEWENTIGGSINDYVSEVIEVPGGYLVGGHSESGISGDKTEDTINFSQDFWIVRLALDGTIIDQNTIGGEGTEILYFAKKGLDGNFIIGGASDSNISGDKTENSLGSFDYWLVKLNNEFLDINELNVPSTFLYPNPSSDYLFINNVSNTGISQIEIFNATGQLVTTIHQYNPSHGINLEGLQVGSYFLLLNNDEEIIPLKFFKN